MGRTIRVRNENASGYEVKEVDIEEAKKLVKAAYADESGGLVVNARTQEVIWDIAADVEEIIIMPEHLIAGG